MFKINSDGSIYVTRGDTCTISVAARVNGEPHKFKAGDVLRIKVYERKACHCVVLQKDFAVLEETETVDLVLTERDTRIGELINKPVDYWYEIELNPMTSPQTIIGYDDDGAKAFRLFPEAADNEVIEVPEPEEIPPVDHELDLLSPRPVENQAVTRGILEVKEESRKGIQQNAEKIAINAEAIQQNAEAIQQNSGLLAEHKEDKSNPHGVTKDQVGLDQVDNTSDMDKPVSTAQAEAINGLRNQMNDHSQSQENPHGVTAAQLGLGNVDNTSDMDKPVSTAQGEAIEDIRNQINDHSQSQENPHGVTAAQIGAVDNFDLLWTNGSPGNGWGDTSITLTTMNNYSWLMIVFRSHKSTAYYQRGFLPVTLRAESTEGRLRMETIEGGGYYRHASITETGVNFTLPAKVSDASTTSNEYCVPYQVYGCNLT